MSDSISPLGVTVNTSGVIRRIGYAYQNFPGPLPVTIPNVYTTQAQNALVVLFSGSGFRESGTGLGFIQAILQIPQIPDASAASSVFANEDGSHKALVPSSSVIPLTAIPVGTRLALNVNQAAGASNVGDVFWILLLEFL